jgi:hypothetical protein
VNRGGVAPRLPQAGGRALLVHAVVVRGRAVGLAVEPDLLCRVVEKLAFAPDRLCRNVGVAVTRRGAHWVPGGRAGRLGWARRSCV